jgi:hypothetical protein
MNEHRGGNHVRTEIMARAPELTGVNFRTFLRAVAYTSSPPSIRAARGMPQARVPCSPARSNPDGGLHALMVAAGR